MSLLHGGHRDTTTTVRPHVGGAGGSNFLALSMHSLTKGGGD